MSDLLPLVGLLPWLGVLEGPYQFDDVTTPVGDPASQSLAAWLHQLGSTLRPLTKLTYALEASVGLGDAPSARRVVSLAILGALGLCLFGLLREMGVRRAIALVGTMLFLAHPIQAECVLALAGRSVILSGLLGLWAAREAHRGHTRAAVLALALSVLARETGLAFGLPVVVAMHLRGELRAGLERVAAVAFVAIGALALHARYRALARFSFDEPIVRSVAAQVAAVPLGLSLWIRPSALSVDHGEALPRGFDDPLFVAGLVLYIVLAAAVATGCRRRSAAPALGAALVLAALLPTQSIVPKLDPLTERPFALAGLGLVVLGTGALEWLASRDASSLPTPNRARAASLVAVAAIVACFYFTTTRGQLYRSEVLLWSDAAAKSPAKARPHANLAMALRDAGDVPRALEAARRAHRIEPFDITSEELCFQLAFPDTCEPLDPRWLGPPTP